MKSLSFLSCFFSKLTRSGAMLALAATLVAFPACGNAEQAAYHVATVAEGLDTPWAMAFLPGDGRILVTERGGRLRIVDPGSGDIGELTGVPEVDARGQGGLLDIAVHPAFPEEGWVYLTWAGEDRGRTATHLGRAMLDLDELALSDLEVLYVADPFFDSTAHYGSRIVFRDGYVFVGFGDRNFKNFGPDHIAQDISNANGATIRLALDGSVPEDNPFVGQQDADPAIWSYGHRNIQAMTVHPDTGAIWLAEHGESGGDEINIVTRGGNYGWPLASYGVDYRTGQPFAVPHDETDEFIAPVHHWGPGRTDHFPPSGMTFYTGEAFAEWQGHLLVGNLYHRYLGLFAVDGESVSSPERLLEGRGLRIRDVAVCPGDGSIYVIADDSDSPLLRLEPTANDARQ
ncbi:quinoprotein glucose dehydrogenase [Desulfonatronum thiosulfatophilum]|uniref:Quinoprotein glucose dehydrogenase n=1 Tax=Desulfonatronum thiosulfatophilum TaxID=617002 RepID=A0A1G6DL05_9BACT|nr:PQQ-dependent sugar dehydrogenase [Desulfonatronum thiosulfatophilum]SDB45820.1 quinoprotein glucose dehydrogenase [Desulfonatronum thiosulfatophilum]